MNDRLIIEEIQKGDLKKLEWIYLEYKSEFVAWLAHNYACDRSEAKEIYQISIVVLYDKIQEGKLDELNGNLKSYLFGIGKNKARELQRSENKVNRLVTPESLQLQELTSFDQKEKERKLQQMEACLEKLGDPCKRLLLLYYKEGLSMQQIADRLGYKNSDTAKNQKCKCIARLRNLFKE